MITKQYDIIILGFGKAGKHSLYNIFKPSTLSGRES